MCHLWEEALKASVCFAVFSPHCAVMPGQPGSEGEDSMEQSHSQLGEGHAR